MIRPAARVSTLDFAPTMSRAEVLAELRRSFAEAGLEEAALDARILLLQGLGINAAEFALRPAAPVGDAGARRLVELARRRLAREPVHRILGEREFWGLPFALSPEVLAPRPDSETVVEAALGTVPGRAAALRLLDLGTGSGCLLVALLQELPNAYGVGLDRSEKSLRIARHNAARNGVGPRAGFVASDWAAALRGTFQLVISNPPYISTGDIAGLPEEVRLHDPRAALDGGSDGLDAYRAILAEAGGLLEEAGSLVLEIGAGQAWSVRGLAGRAGLEVVATRRDLGGRERALVTRRLRS
jgi:release factor glutamine methyltransferase